MGRGRLQDKGRAMFSHVMVGTSDVERAKAFFEAVFAPLGLEIRNYTPDLVSFRAPGTELPFLTIVKPLDGQPASAGNGTMVALLAADRAAVDAAYAAAMAGGGTCEGPPGLRPHYHDDYYGAYFRDPDGNKLHVVCHEAAA